MTRPLRLEYPGALYHITTRGNARSTIFFNYQDREDFLSILESVVKRYNVICHAYCLMDNHYHLMLETPDANLSMAMRQLNGIYTQKHNRRHQKSGHIFQGRFKAILVEKESYLLELCRYVVLNPVRAGIVEEITNWPWSSYGATAGLQPVPPCLSVDWILALFSSDRTLAQERFQVFIRDGLPAFPRHRIRRSIFLGNDEFVEKFRVMLSEKELAKEIPRVHRYAARPSLDKLFTYDHSRTVRDQAIFDAHIKYGYTFKQIGEHLGIHYTTVSKVVSRIETAKS